VTPVGARSLIGGSSVSCRGVTGALVFSSPADSLSTGPPAAGSPATDFPVNPVNSPATAAPDTGTPAAPSPFDEIVVRRPYAASTWGSEWRSPGCYLTADGKVAD
jgi:hypothetical protein